MAGKIIGSLILAVLIAACRGEPARKSLLGEAAQAEPTPEWPDCSEPTCHRECAPNLPAQSLDVGTDYRDCVRACQTKATCMDLAQERRSIGSQTAEEIPPGPVTDYELNSRTQLDPGK